MTFLPKNVEGILNFKEMEQQASFQISIKPKFPENSLISRTFQDSFSFPGHLRTFQKVGTLHCLKESHYVKMASGIISEKSP